MSTGPTLSIVIASLNPGAVIVDCLEALEAQRTPDVEVLVVDGSTDDTAERVRRRFPWARVISPPDPPSLPRLRGHGIAEARAPIVGLLDAWCLVQPGWVAAAIRAHRDQPALAAGGPVELASSERGLSAWSSYLFDYWEFVPPLASGPANVLPGNNIVYKRSALPDNETLRRNGFWKSFTNERLKTAPNALWSTTELGVFLRRPTALGRFIRSRFHHGRSYAAMRVQKASAVVRLRWAAITPALPLLFVSRQLRGLMGKTRPLAWFVACTPILLACHVSWAWGETCGYLAGPGRSHDAIRS